MRRAKKIARKHGNLAAAYFLVYSLVGARETGFLLLWLNGMFVYCERKTGFCHYFHSQLLHQYFQLLGLKGGIMYRPSKEHLEAMKIAIKYVRRYYGSHQSSRRIHYMLKKQGYIEYDNEVYNLEIIYYEDGDLGVRLWDNNMQEALYEENITNKSITKRGKSSRPIPMSTSTSTTKRHTSTDQREYTRTYDLFNTLLMCGSSKDLQSVPDLINIWESHS